MLRPKFLAKFKGVNCLPTDANVGLIDSENKENPPCDTTDYSPFPGQF